MNQTFVFVYRRGGEITVFGMSPDVAAVVESLEADGWHLIATLDACAYIKSCYSSGALSEDDEAMYD